MRLCVYVGSILPSGMGAKKQAPQLSSVLVPHALHLFPLLEELTLASAPVSQKRLGAVGLNGGLGGNSCSQLQRAAIFWPNLNC